MAMSKPQTPANPLSATISTFTTKLYDDPRRIQHRVPPPSLTQFSPENERARTRSSPSTTSYISSSPPSSSAPRKHTSPPILNGRTNLEVHPHPTSGKTPSSAAGSKNAIFSSEQSARAQEHEAHTRERSRGRVASLGSSEQDEGIYARKQPPVPGQGASSTAHRTLSPTRGASLSPLSSPPPLLPRTSRSGVGITRSSSSAASLPASSVVAIPPTPTASHKPSSSVPSAQSASGSPSGKGGFINPPPAAPGPSATTFPSTTTTTSTAVPSSTAPATPRRKPSLASPSPPTPLVPSTALPRAAAPRSPPAPLNLAGTSTPSPHFYHHHKQHSASPSQPTHPSPLSNNAAQAPSHAQYVHYPQRSAMASSSTSAPTSGQSNSPLPESPSTRAMMKRLLAKPAPPSSGTPTTPHFGYHGATTSGSESEGLYGGAARQAQKRRKDLNGMLGYTGGVAGNGVHSRGGEGNREQERAWKSEPEDVAYERFAERRKDKERASPPGPGHSSNDTSIEFDMNLDSLDRGIATLGQWAVVDDNDVDSDFMATLSPTFEQLPSSSLEKKRSRNVLRRKPSATGTSSPRSPQPPSRSQSVSAPNVRNTTSPVPILPLPSAPLSPLSMTMPTPKNRESIHRSLSSSGSPFTGSGHLGVPRTSLRPPLPSHSNSNSPHNSNPASRSSSVSRESPSRSRGSSPVRVTNPIMSSLFGSRSGSGSATASPSTPLAPSLSEKERRRELEHTERKLKERKEKAKSSLTPAASLIEAYKAREKERAQREEVKIGLDTQIPHPRGLQSSKRSKSQPSLSMGFRRGSPPTTASNSGFAGSSKITRKASATGVFSKHQNSPKPAINDGYVSTSDSGVSHLIPRVRGGTPAAEAVLGGGLGFANIERLVGIAGADSDAGDENGQDAVIPTKLTQLHDGVKLERASTSSSSGVATPYYTVFGATSGRVVAVGGPEDSWDAYAKLGGVGWDSKLLGSGGSRRSIEKAKKEKEREGLGRSLSRKVSARWRKQGGTVVGAFSEDGHGHQERVGRPVIRPRASMQERRKGESIGRREREDVLDVDEKKERLRNRRSLRLSIDKFVDATDPERMPPLRKGDDDSGLGKSKTSGRTDSSSPRGGGSRLWKLMRRISVGGLKEKYQESGSPPPVPALPDHVLTATRSNESKKSLPTSPLAVSRSPKMPLSPPTPPTAQPQPPRPSTTTRSSSPVSSSDVASSKFFHRTHSARSSTSSFGEELPPPVPLPPAQRFGKHIVSPGLLDKIHGPDEPQSPNQNLPKGVSVPQMHISLNVSPVEGEWTMLRSPSVELPSLTLPPRRPQAAISSLMKVPTSSTTPPQPSVFTENTLRPSEFEVDRSESPTIPSFSTNDAVNAFPARRFSASLSASSRASPISSRTSPSTTSAATFGRNSSTPSPNTFIPQTLISLPPPPRPLRSAQRPVPAPARVNVNGETQAVESETQFEPAVSTPTPSVARNRRSSGGFSTTSNSTLRPTHHRRSSSIGFVTSGGHGVSLALPGHSTFGRSASPPSPSELSISLSFASTTASDGNPNKAAFTFRELDTNAPKQTMSEKEKADKWDDLLQRSEMAGGTLHLAGGKGLKSDRLRFQ